jgi:outer membrane protein OmpA-like peptidoglycan-associated protein
MCTDEGILYPKLPPGPLPPRYTIELETWSKGPEYPGHWFHILWFDAEGRQIGDLGLYDQQDTRLRLLDKDIASKLLPTKLGPGLHTMRVMATSSSIKCYIDHERVANVPLVEGFEPVDFRVHMDPWLNKPDNPMLIGTLRYAEGGKTLRQQLDETGRIVTHGILFDSGSAKIKAESYKTLADIAQLLAGDAALRLSIEGHTDSDGADDANMKLSQDRAGAVRAYLVESFKIDGGRLETKGFGETKPIDANTTAEGKANNRRVELVKL